MTASGDRPADRCPRSPGDTDRPSPEEITAFRDRVLSAYDDLRRDDLPWRRTTDPYRILVSEFMLQQTQVARVQPKYESFVAAFPDFDSLASAPLEAVLREWQGLGYNRRALWLKRAAEMVVHRFGGRLPHDVESLQQLPGVGHATASQVAAFAFGVPTAFVETNIRAVYLHCFFADRDDVSDSELLPYIEATLDRDDPRAWYYALLDYGTHLKRVVPNPSRRSRHHTRQSPFEGSDRQLRARLLRILLDEPGGDIDALTAATGDDEARIERLLRAMTEDGLLVERDSRYSVA